MREANTVSVVIPMFNVENFLDKCLNSIIVQTYKKLEIIVVDDGSSDGSVSIVREKQKKDSRIVLLKNPSKGVSSARNHGLLAANGKWVMFCDSDDWIEDDLIERLVVLAEEHDLDYVGSGFCEDYFNGDDLYETKKYGVSEQIIGDRDTFPLDIGYVFRCKRLLIATPCVKIFKKDLLIGQKLLFNESSVYGEDFEFNLKALCQIQRYGFIPVEHYHYKNQIGVGSVDKIKKTDIVSEVDYIFDAADKLSSRYRNTDLEYQLRDCLFDLYKLSIRKMLSENNRKQRDIILDHLMVSQGFEALSSSYNIFRILKKLYSMHLNPLVYFVIKNKLFKTK